MSLNLMVGNIGSGKSIIASKLANMGCCVFNMDSFQEMISGGQYGMYDIAKKTIYQKAEDLTIEESLKQGFSVVVDRTNMDIKRRKRFIEIGKKYGAVINAYDFGCGSEENITRRAKNTRGVPMKVWKEVFESMKKSYEQPTKEEGFDNIIQPPNKYVFHAFDFDGTITENKFPEIGEIINGTVEKMNALYDDLKNIIIIWTCRNGEYELMVRDFLIKHKIKFDFINQNPIFDTGSRKIFAHTYYDDRNSILNF